MQIEPLFLVQGHDGPVHPYPHLLESEVLEVIASGVGADFQRLAQMKIGEMECPVHHQRATVHIVTVMYAEATESFEGDPEIETCCPEFRRTVLEQLQ
jgi:hypothetical protein